MKNRAKCKLCDSIIESFHKFDYVTCKCSEISVSGGTDLMECGARDWENFVRIDDAGKEISIKIVDINNDITPPSDTSITKPSKSELLEMLNNMAKNIEDLPSSAMIQPVTHYDLLSLLLLLQALFEADCKDLS
jgi:hypothetical protein